MTAPAPSPYEQAVIDRFGIFAEERVVEEAIKRSLDSDDPNDWEPRALAVAAVAAYRAAQDGGAEEFPWCNLPICPEGSGGAHRITTGRCMVRAEKAS